MFSSRQVTTSSMLAAASRAASGTGDRPGQSDVDGALLFELEIAALYSAVQRDLKKCQGERDAYKCEADGLRQTLLELQGGPDRRGQDQQTAQLREKMDRLETEVKRLRVELAHRTDEIEGANRLITTVQTAQTLREHELVKALNYRTDELDSARQELRQAHESAKAAMVEITMLQSELDLARKNNSSLQGEVENLRRQFQMDSSSRCSEMETSSLPSSSSILSSTSSSCSAAPLGQPIFDVSGVSARVEALGISPSTPSGNGIFKNTRSFMF